MEISPNRLIALSVGLFAGIVAINLVAQYRSNEQFKQSLTGFDFTQLRARLNREEGLTAPDFAPLPQRDDSNDYLEDYADITTTQED